MGIVNDVLIIDTLKLGSSLLHGKGIWVVRKIVFGAGDECKKILPHIKGRISFVVDNNEDKWGTDILGTEIKSPEEINEDDEIYIATSPRYVHEIVDMLSIRGLHNIKMARSLEKVFIKHKTTMFVHLKINTMENLVLLLERDQVCVYVI